MMINQQTGFSRRVVRVLSTKIQKTPEQIKEGLERVDKHKKFIQASAHPTSMTLGVGSGKDLHVPKNIAELAALNGMPEEQANRTVMIQQRMNKTLQSGAKFVHQWQITWKNTNRWSNPLMGWTSTNDPMSNLKLTFDTKEEAIAFANRNGWKFEVNAETSKNVVAAGTHLYKHNFLDKRVLSQMKLEGPKTQIWKAPTYGESHFFMPLKYHGDGVVTQHGPPQSSEK